MRLNREYFEKAKNLNPNVTVGPMGNMPEKVIQFGEGNFLRAFVDWHFNELNKKGLFNGKIVVVQPLEKGMIDVINEQDGLYTLLLRGIQNGVQIERSEIITALNRVINPYTDWQAFLKCASNPELRYIVSNTTEAGIEYTPADFPVNECPASFPAKVTALLYERYKIFNGADDKGMIIIPCELIENNGITLKEYILRHASDWNLESGFSKWIEKSNYFCNTLVDRIVPGYPADEIEVLTNKLGYEDRVIVSAEIFHLWVIQGDKRAAAELPFNEAGLNVVWTEDISAYRTLKVRILNGAHTMFTIPSYLKGHDTVKESVENKLTGSFIVEGLFNEILPTLDFPEEQKLAYTKSVIERFQNPFIKHYLESITLNSVSKFKVRVLPSLIKYYEIKNSVPDVLSFSLAALIAYYRGYCRAEQVKTGIRDRKLKDNEEVISFFEKLRETQDCNESVKTVLANHEFWDYDLNSIDTLTEKVCKYYQSISKHGMNAAIEKLLNNRLVA